MLMLADTYSTSEKVRLFSDIGHLFLLAYNLARIAGITPRAKV
jgi:hypothetical protein